jgi:hypothetical protein
MTSPNEIRPRTIAEILDRSLSLLVQKIVPLATVLAIVAIPLTILEIVLTPQSKSFVNDLQNVLATAHDLPAIQRAILEMGTFRGASSLGLVYLCQILVTPLEWTAFVFAMWQFFIGAPAQVAQAYRAALRRWLSVLVVGLSYFVIYLAAVFLLAFVAGIFTIGVTMIAHLSAIIFTVIIFVLLFVGYIVSGVLLFTPWQLAFIATVTEGLNPFRAVGLGLRRAYARGIRLRSALVGVVAITISLGGTLLLVATSAGIAALVHIDALATIITAIGDLLLNGVIAAFLVGYALDVRVRREGFDLELQTQAQPTV